MKLVSACLLALTVIFEAKTGNKNVAEEFAKGNLFPVCPKFLGGLPVPRVPAEIQGCGDGGDVLDGKACMVN
jgi:uncharacterized protein YbbK (DUF523 family)